MDLDTFYSKYEVICLQVAEQFKFGVDNINATFYVNKNQIEASVFFYNTDNNNYYVLGSEVTIKDLTENEAKVFEYIRETYINRLNEYLNQT